jgi:hypothetical protein
MHRAICAVYVERWEDRLYYRKQQRNRTILFSKSLTTLWRSEIHMNLKIDADAQNRRWRRFRVRRRAYHTYQGKGRQYAGKSECVYGISSVKNKIKNQ